MKRIFFLIVLAMGAMAIDLTSATEDELLVSKLFLKVCGNPKLPEDGSSLEKKMDHFYQLALEQGISHIESFFKSNNDREGKREECEKSLTRALDGRRSKILGRESKKSESLDGIICIGFFSCQETEIGERLHGGESLIREELTRYGLLVFASSIFNLYNDFFDEL
jgi:hypothetical protein